MAIGATEIVPEPEFWPLQGPYGPERWQRQAGRFTEIAFSTPCARTLKLADRSFELEGLRLRGSTCPHAGPWPNAFRYCIECGTPLPEPAALPPARNWSAPFGSLTGLPILEGSEDVSALPQTRREERLPGSADLGFVVAGTPPTLFAYDLATGLLRARLEGDRTWQDLEQWPRAHNLPRWSWAAAVLPEGVTPGFAIATNEGPVLRRVGPNLDTRPLRPAASAGILAGLGGVACVEGHLVMPVRLASGLALACLAPEQESWSLLAVEGGAAALEVFAAPVVHYSDAFWCTAAGLLSLSCVNGTLSAAFRPWQEGLLPALAIRPLQAENGTFYALMRRGEHDPVFHSLVLPDREPELRPYRLCFSSGNAVFADGKRRRLPWDDTGSRGEFSLGDDEFLLPLLAFSARRFLVAVCAGRSTLTRFIETTGDATTNARLSPAFLTGYQTAGLARQEHQCARAGGYRAFRVSRAPLYLCGWSKRVLELAVAARCGGWMIRRDGWALLLAVALAFKGAGAHCPDAESGLPMAYLVQNSGWMEPFYDDPQSQFRQLVSGFIAQSAASGGKVAIADFNQDGEVAGRTSPKVYFCGRADPADIARAIGQIDLPHQRSGAYADADFDGALVGGINKVLDGQQGIVWIVTNNKNSPGNSQQVNENTRAFAARLSKTHDLSMIVAYPLRMPVQGHRYAEKGLIIYGIARGPHAATRLGEIVRSQGLQQMFADPAVRLKPLEQTPLVFTPLSTPPGGMTVAVASNGALVVDGVPGGQASRLSVEGNLTSQYYPQVIDEADVHVAWRDLDGGAVGGGIQGTVEPSHLHRLAPMDVLQNVRIAIDIPAVPRAPGLAGLLQKDVTISGTLVIGLTDLKLVLPETFREKMTQIAALDQLPAVFFDYQTITDAETSVPVSLRVHFSALPLLLALGGAAATLAALGTALLLVRREREQVAMVGGQSRRVRLRPFETRPVTLPDGRKFRVRGTLFGQANVAEMNRQDRS